MARTAIIGGGVLGCQLALRLARLGHDITLYEAGPELGGLAAAWTVGDVRWDRHYHVTLKSDLRTQAMYDELGLHDQVQFAVTGTGYYGPDRALRSVSSAAAFLRLPGLTIVDKVRIASTIAYGSQIRSGARMEHLTVESWLRRWSGDRAFEIFWLPLLRAKLGDLYTRTSAAFIWATIRRLFAARRNGIDQEMFGHVTGGHATVFDRFHERLTADGVTIRLDCPVTAVRCGTSSRLDVEVDGALQPYDHVVVTTGSRIAARLCVDLLDRERQRLADVGYVGIVCVSLLLDRPLDDYYLTYITDPATPFTAVIEMTALIDPCEVGGHTLVYLPKYTDASDPLFAADDDDVVAQFMTYLHSMYPDLAPEDVLASRVSRVPEVFAIPTLGYSQAMPTLTTSVPGLVTAGSAHLPFSTLNVNDVLALTDEIIEHIASDPPTTGATPQHHE